MNIDLDKALLEHPNNFAELLSTDDQDKLGEEVIEQFMIDKGTRAEWETRSATWLKLASQVKENKNYPWPKAANIKYPLLTTASIQFNARANQSLINNTRPVFGKIVGEDNDGKKASVAERISKHMSHQVLEEVPDWEDGNDRLLMILPLAGIMYKKVYQAAEGIRSDVILPQNLIINYNAKDFQKARKSYVYSLSSNEVHEQVAGKAFIEQDLGEPYKEADILPNEVEDASDLISGSSPSSGEDTTDTYTIVEQHHMWDLDGDGYKEPYIVKVELKSRKLLQIIPRFDDESIQYTEEGDVLKIKPENYFIRFPFVPDFNSPIYAQGFGTLLGPLNEAINTTINLLLDTGTLGNMPSGYLGRGVRLPQGGTMKLKPGQWKVLPTTGDDIRKSIFPMPVKEPSSALLNLLNLLITAGEETASVADLMKGGNPGQNQPFSTTMAVLEQGLQVFTSIYKRLFRAFSEEYSRIFYLNSKYLPREHYFNVLDVDKDKMQSVQIGQGDYDVTSINVMPAADPDIVSETQKLIKAESLGTKLEMGLPINVQEATKRWLEAEGHEDIDKLMDVPPPQTPPDVQLEIDKFQDQSAREWAKLILQANTAEVEATKDIAQSIAHLARAEHMQQSAVIEGQKMLFDQMSSIAKSREDWLVQVEKLRIEDKKVEKTANANKNGKGD